MGIFGYNKKTIDKQIELVKNDLCNERKVTITGNIDNANSYSVIMQIMKWYNQDSKEPIVIFIDSNGGNVNSGIAIYDVIKTLECDIVTVCNGTANGLSALILAAGTKGKRYTAKQSKSCLGCFESDKPEDKEGAQAINNLIEKIYKNVESETSMTFKTVKKKSKSQLSSKDMLKAGMVDTIILKEVVNTFLS